MMVDDSSQTIHETRQKWRTRFVCVWMGIMFISCWLFSLSGLIQLGVWDREYALEKIHSAPPDPTFYNSTSFADVGESYLMPPRYIWYIPHVSAAIIWWNFYFLQLVPAVRHKYKWFHRWLGRLLLLVAVVQVCSGIGLGSTSSDSTIKAASLPFALAIAYCVYNALRYAVARDIKRHKYWVLRLVGYMQVIAAQRFWLVVLLTTHQCGCYFLYPSIKGLPQSEIETIVMKMFSDSFVFALGTAIYITEWYLAGSIGMLDDPEPIAAKEGYSTIPATPEIE